MRDHMTVELVSQAPPGRPRNTTRDAAFRTQPPSPAGTDAPTVMYDVFLAMAPGVAGGGGALGGTRTSNANVEFERRPVEPGAPLALAFTVAEAAAGNAGTVTLALGTVMAVTMTRRIVDDCTLNTILGSPVHPLAVYALSALYTTWLGSAAPHTKPPYDAFNRVGATG